MLPARSDPRAPQDRLARRELPALRGVRERWDRRVLQARWAPRVRKVQRVLRVREVRKVPRDRQELLER